MEITMQQIRWNVLLKLRVNTTGFETRTAFASLETESSSHRLCRKLNAFLNWHHVKSSEAIQWHVTAGTKSFFFLFWKGFPVTFLLMWRNWRASENLASKQAYEDLVTVISFGVMEFFSYCRQLKATHEYKLLWSSEQDEEGYTGSSRTDYLTTQQTFETWLTSRRKIHCKERLRYSVLTGRTMILFKSVHVSNDAIIYDPYLY